MGLLLLVIRIGLAAILLVSGSAKLLDRAGTRQAYEGFRLPARFAPAVGGLLPIVEIVLALTLLPSTLVPVSAVIRAVVSRLFTFAVFVTGSAPAGVKRLFGRGTPLTRRPPKPVPLTTRFEAVRKTTPPRSPNAVSGT